MKNEQVEFFLFRLLLSFPGTKRRRRRRPTMKRQRNFQCNIVILLRNEVRFILLKVVPFSFLFFLLATNSFKRGLNRPPPPFYFCKITFQVNFIEDEIPAGNQRIKATLLTLYPKIFLICHGNGGMKC